MANMLLELDLSYTAECGWAPYSYNRAVEAFIRKIKRGWQEYTRDLLDSIPWHFEMSGGIFSVLGIEGQGYTYVFHLLLKCRLNVTVSH